MLETSTIEYATLNRRMFAALIDTILLTIVLSPIMALLSSFVFEADDKQTIQQIIDIFVNGDAHLSLNMLVSSGILIRSLLSNFIAFLLMTIIIVLFWHYTSATPGKMVARCKIVDANSGMKPTTQQLIIRSLSYIISTLTFCIGFIMIAFTHKNQGLHDKIANTLVIVTPKKSKFD